MQKVRLVGNNLSKFGEVWETNCSTMRDIFKLIDCQYPDFRPYLTEAVEAGVSFEVKRGSTFLEYPEELFMSVGHEDIVITEVPAGAKSGGAKILAAAFLVIVTGGNYAWVNGIAGSLAISGLTQLLAPGLETDADEVNDGYSFQGANNNISQGMPVPVAYGELRVGGAPISVAYEQFDADSIFNPPSGADTTDGNGVETGENENGPVGVIRALIITLEASDTSEAPDIVHRWDKNLSSAPTGNGTTGSRYIVGANDYIYVQWYPSQSEDGGIPPAFDAELRVTPSGIFQDTQAFDLKSNTASNAVVVRADDALNTIDGALAFSYELSRNNDSPLNSSITLYFQRTAVEEEVDPATIDAILKIEGPSEVDEGDTTSEYTVYVVDSNGNSIQAETSIAVNLAYSGTASSSTDFTPVSSVTIASGNSAAVFTLAVAEEGVEEEGAETIIITPSTTDDGGFDTLTVHSGNFGSVTTVINDYVPPIGLPGGNETDPEAEADYDMKIELSGGNLQLVAESLPDFDHPDVGDGSFSSPYELIAGDKVKFLPGVFSSTGTIQVTPNDGLFTENSTKRMNTRLSTSGNNGKFAEYVVADGGISDPILVDFYSEKEQGGNLELYFKRARSTVDILATATIIGPSLVLEGQTTDNFTIFLTDDLGNTVEALEDLDFTITYSGTAVQGTQYSTASSPLTRTISAGESQVSFTIDTLTDVNTTSESIVQTISLGAGEDGGFSSLTIAGASVSTTIEDSGAATVSVSNGTVVGVSENENFAAKAYINFDSYGAISVSGGYSDTQWSSSSSYEVNQQYAVRANITAGGGSAFFVNQEGTTLDWHRLGRGTVQYTLEDYYDDSEENTSSTCTVIFEFATWADLDTIIETATINFSSTNTYQAPTDGSDTDTEVDPDQPRQVEVEGDEFDSGDQTRRFVPPEP